MPASISKAVRGGLAGFLATVPMTAVMEGLRCSLPWYERYALPPRLIVQNLTLQSGIRRHLTREQEAELAWCAHFLFGTAMGAVYGATSSAGKEHRYLRGALFGCCVWAISYHGWLPAMDILPGTAFPLRRTALLIAAHLLWGVALAEIDERLRKVLDESSSEAGNSKSEQSESEVEIIESWSEVTAV